MKAKNIPKRIMALLLLLALLSGIATTASAATYTAGSNVPI